MDELLTHALKTFGSQFGCKLKLNELRGNGINRYKKYIHKACSISEEEIAIDWVFLEDFAVVRNAIIHANGNKSIVSNKKELETVVARHNPNLKLESNVKLFVSSEFVELCINTAANTCLAINDYAQNRL